MYRDDMARRRLQQKGDFYCSGGYWMLRWHEDQIKIDGTFKRGWSRSVCIGPCAEPGALRRRLAWDNHLSRLDQNNRTPQSILTVREFVERKFVPEHVAYKKHGGREHYRSELPCVLDGVPDKKIARGGRIRFRPGEIQTRRGTAAHSSRAWHRRYPVAGCTERGPSEIGWHYAAPRLQCPVHHARKNCGVGNLHPRPAGRLVQRLKPGQIRQVTRDEARDTARLKLSASRDTPATSAGGAASDGVSRGHDEYERGRDLRPALEKNQPDGRSPSSPRAFASNGTRASGVR